MFSFRNDVARNAHTGKVEARDAETNGRSEIAPGSQSDGGRLPEAEKRKGLRSNRKPSQVKGAREAHDRPTVSTPRHHQLMLFEDATMMHAVRAMACAPFPKRPPVCRRIPCFNANTLSQQSVTAMLTQPEKTRRHAIESDMFRHASSTANEQTPFLNPNKHIYAEKRRSADRRFEFRFMPRGAYVHADVCA